MVQKSKLGMHDDFHSVEEGMQNGGVGHGLTMALYGTVLELCAVPAVPPGCIKPWKSGNVSSRLHKATTNNHGIIVQTKLRLKSFQCWEWLDYRECRDWSSSDSEYMRWSPGRVQEYYTKKRDGWIFRSQKFDFILDINQVKANKPCSRILLL